jgi:hypothetical protein
MATILDYRSISPFQRSVLVYPRFSSLAFEISKAMRTNGHGTADEPSWKLDFCLHGVGEAYVTLRIKSKRAVQLFFAN